MRERDETSCSSRANEKQLVRSKERKTDTWCASAMKRLCLERANKKLRVRSKEREPKEILTPRKNLEQQAGTRLQEKKMGN